MSNLCGRPIFQKGAKPVRAKRNRDFDHMEKVARLSCCICDAFGMVQTSPTQVHHCISGRYGTLRAHDRCTIPLCEGCHQGLRDTSKLAIHRNKRAWEAKYGFDHEYIAPTLDAVEAVQ